MSFYECKKCGGAVGLFCTCDAASADKTAATVQPVAWANSSELANIDNVVEIGVASRRRHDLNIPLYAAPPSAPQPQAAQSDVIQNDARYRWWRDHGYTVADEVRSIENELLPAGETFATPDAAIDAALESAKREQGLADSLPKHLAQAGKEKD